MSDEDLQQQADECEALASIYPEEFSIIPSGDWEAIVSEAAWSEPVTQLVSVNVKPTEEDPSKIHVAVVLYCGMPASYPSSSAAFVRVKAKKGLSDEQIDELQGIAETTSAENIGMPTVFTIANAVQEWLSENNVPGQDGSMYSDMMRRMQRKDVEEKKITQRAAIKAAADSEQRDKAQIDPEELERIRKRQAGVQVTAASFVAWKIKFDAEMAAKGTVVSESTDNQKLSGKQFFLAQQAAGGGANNDEEALILEGEGEFDDEALQRGLLAAMGELDDDDEDYVDDEEDDDDDEDYEEEES